MGGGEGCVGGGEGCVGGGMMQTTAGHPQRVTLRTRGESAYSYIHIILN